jgi:hypothetical protein
MDIHEGYQPMLYFLAQNPRSMHQGTTTENGGLSDGEVKLRTIREVFTHERKGKKSTGVPPGGPELDATLLIPAAILR